MDGKWSDPEVTSRAFDTPSLEVVRMQAGSGLGPLTGEGRVSPVDFKKWQLLMPHVFVAYLCICRMLNRNDIVACDYDVIIFFCPRRMSLSLMLPVDFKKRSCRHVEFRSRGP